MHLQTYLGVAVLTHNRLEDINNQRMHAFDLDILHMVCIILALKGWDMLFLEMNRPSGSSKNCKLFKTTHSKIYDDILRMSVVVVGKSTYLVSEAMCSACKVQGFNVTRISS